MKDYLKVNEAVIPIAGLGTRMLPVTKAIPKEMLPIVTKPIIQIVVEEVEKAGFKEIIFVTHSSKSAVENHFDSSFELEATLDKRVKRILLKDIKGISNLKISIQSIRQGYARGLGDAIMCAKPIIQKEPFAVILPDMIIKESTTENNLSNMKKNFEKTGVSQILLGKVEKKMISNYGIAEVKGKNISKIVEKPSPSKAPSNLFVVGRYIFENSIFKFLSNLKPAKTGEIELTDAIQNFLKNKHPISFCSLKGVTYDCGNKLGYLKAIVEYALEDKSIEKEFRSFIKKIK